jgi:hypothetical protein
MGLAVLAVVVLTGLAVFQALLIAGQPLGRFAWGGQHTVLPTGLRVGSAVSIALYAGFALLILCASGALALLPTGFVDVSMWVLTGYLALGIGVNAVSRSMPERLVMTPVVAVLFTCCLVIALALR